MGGVPDLPLNPAVSGWLAVIGVVLAVAFGAIALVQNRQNKREKEPCWAVQSFALVSQSRAVIPDLEVLYRDRKVATLTVSEVLLWNNGRATINGADAATANPLRIVPNEHAEILAASVIATNSHSQPQIEVTDRGAIINFDYLDQGQGIVFRVVHTGTRSQEPRVVGDLRGARALHQIEHFRRDLVQPPQPSLSRREQLRRLIVSRLDLVGVVFAGIWALIFRQPVIAVVAAVTLAFAGLLSLFGPQQGRAKQPSGFTPVETQAQLMEDSALIADDADRSVTVRAE